MSAVAGDEHRDGEDSIRSRLKRAPASTVDFSESDRGFPLLAATLKLNAYVYGVDAAGSAVPPAATPPATTTEGVESPPAATEATGSEATG